MNLQEKHVKLRDIIQLYFWSKTILRLNHCWIKTFSIRLTKHKISQKIYLWKKEEIFQINLTKSYVLLRQLISFKKMFKKKLTHLSYNKIATIKLFKVFLIKILKFWLERETAMTLKQFWIWKQTYILMKFSIKLYQ